MKSKALLVRILGLAAIYTLSGWLGLLLAIPPGYATAIFPASGFALAGLLICGNRVWPGIWLGSFSLNMIISAPVAINLFSISNIGLSAVIATGATLQGYLGHYLIVRFTEDYRMLTRENDILKFLLLGGPISCLVSASVGVFALTSWGVISLNKAAYSWWNWWVGDTIGIVIAAPLAMILTHQSHDIWKRRRTSVAIPMCFSLVAVVFLFIKASEWENDRLHDKFRQQAHQVGHDLETQIDKHIAALHSIRNFYLSSTYVDKQEFHVFTKNFMENHPGIQALEWVPRVTRDEVEKIYYEAKNNNIENFTLTELDNQGELIPATERAEYYPVFFVEPVVGNEQVLGFDLGSNPVHLSALEKARDTGQAIATERITLDQKSGKQYAILVFYPIYEYGTGNNIRARIDGLKGFSLGVFRFGDMIQAVLNASIVENYYIRLEDLSAQDSSRLLFTSTQNDLYSSEYHNQIFLSVAGREYKLILTPKELYISNQTNWQAWLVLASGLVFTSLLGAFLLVLTGRTVHVERLIEEQTHILKGVNDQLHNNNMLLSVISQAQSEYITDMDTRTVFNNMLEGVLQSTKSEYGFIGEALYTHDGQVYLKTHAITDISWDEQTRQFYQEHASKGLEFHNLDTLFGAVLQTGDVVISNDHANDTRASGIPDQHPKLRAFLGIPFYKGTQLSGMVGIANREHGYQKDLLDYLEPFLATCANMIEAYRSDQRRQMSEQALVENEYRMRAILDNASESIITINDECVIESVNPATERLFGYDADHMVGHKLSLLLPQLYQATGSSMQADRTKLAIRKLMDGLCVVEGHKRDGTSVPIEVSMSEIKFKDRILYSGIIRDLTVRRRVEKLKDEFVSTVSHELRTPLTSIQASLKLLTCGHADLNADKGQELLNIASINSERLLLLVNDLLDMEKIESGKIQLDFQAYNLLSLVNLAIEEISGYADKFTVNVVLSKVPCEQIMVNVDGNRLIQVINNILSNAIKYSNQNGKVEIEIEQEEGTVKVSISDRGQGIPLDFQQRIFQKFSQADGSNTRKQDGTGLGLNISKKLVELMAGEINYYTKVEQGTTFYFTLPVFSSGPSHALSA